MITSKKLEDTTQSLIEEKVLRERINRKVIVDAINEQNLVKVVQVSNQFNHLLSKLDQDRILYSFNVLPRCGYVERCVKQSGASRETNTDLTERFLHETYSKIIHWLSCSIEPKYNKRQRHKERTIKSLVCFEHHKKNDTTAVVSPHIHATLAIHPDWNERFLSLFVQKTERDRNNRNQYYLNHEFFMNRGLYELNYQIKETSLKDQMTQLEWIGYSTDQLTQDFQGTGVFIHEGFRSHANHQERTYQ